MRGADALIRALERAGVDTVFGIPGGACLPIYDALHDSPIRHVLMRHEAAAGHAAEGNGDAGRQRMLAAFMASSEHELAFWDAAFNAGRTERQRRS